jgi:hypothetical protein
LTHFDKSNSVLNHDSFMTKAFPIIAKYKYLVLMVDIRYSHVHYVIKEYGELT